MMLFIVIIHAIICAALIGLVLIQRGRGGGLVESFSGVESMFGTKTNAFLTRTTTVLSVLFFITCLSLAVLSVRQSKSLIKNTKTEETAKKVKPVNQPDNKASQELSKKEEAIPVENSTEEQKTEEAPRTE